MHDPQPSPTTCRAAVFDGPGKELRLADFEIPQLRAGEVLVRISLCAVCGSDLRTIQGLRREPTPSILGHEAVGCIAAMHQPTSDWRGQPLSLGDRVTWSIAISCFDCPRCRAGYPQKCQQVAKYGHVLAEDREALSGGMAEYIILRPGSSILRLDDTVCDSLAAVANCSTATACAVLRRAGAIAGKRMLIFGGGLLGLTASAIASTRGAQSITLVDIDAERVELALRFGATHGVPWRDQARWQQAEGFDIVLELSGSAEATVAALDLAAIAGCVVLAGTVSPTRVQVNAEAIVRRLISIHGVHNYAPHDLVDATEFLGGYGDQFPFGELLNHVFPLAEIDRALQYALAAKPLRVLIRP